MKQIADRFSARNDAARFTPSFYRMVVVALWAGGLSALLSSFLLWRWRHQLAAVLNLRSSAAGRELLKGWQELAGECRRHVLGLSIVMATALCLRLVYINQAMRYDEAYTFLNYANRGIVRLFLDYVPNNQLLHTEMVWLSTRMLGDSAAAIRMPAFLAGMAVIVLMYQYTARYAGGTAGLLAAALGAVNADLILFSTNARGYMFLAALFLILVQVAEALGKDPRRSGLWVWFLILSVAGLYTVPTMVYGVIAAVVLFAVERHRTAHGEGWIASYGSLAATLLLVGLLTGLLYLPVILGSGAASILSNRYVSSVPVDRLFPAQAEILQQTWMYWTAGWPIVSVGVLLAALSGALFSSAPYARFLRYTLLTSGVLILLQRVAPPSRTWLFVLPIYLATAAAQLDVLLRRVTRGKKLVAVIAPAVLAVGSVGILTTDAVRAMPETGINVDAAEAASIIARESTSGDLILATTTVSAPTMYYLYRRGFPQQRWLEREPQRVLAVLEKSPEEVFGPAEMDASIDIAFRESGTTVSGDRFPARTKVAETPHALVMALER